MTSQSTIDKSGLTARGIVPIGLFLLMMAVAVGLLLLFFRPHALSGRGGVPVPGELVISIPQFFQDDRAWRNDPLGNTPGTLGGEGCAVTSASMVLAHFGADVDPGRLNAFLRGNCGYEGAGWLRWESAADYTSGLVEKAYEGAPSYALIDWNLFHGNPVIVRVRLPSGITHFVVIVGKRGYSYLIRDPATRGKKGIYPLEELGAPIEALRYYLGTPLGV
jgi:hypothetical protein